jgi:hypothetical protein
VSPFLVPEGTHSLEGEGLGLRGPYSDEWTLDRYCGTLGILYSYISGIYVQYFVLCKFEIMTNI